MNAETTVKCQKCERVIGDGPKYYIITVKDNDKRLYEKEICGICHYHYAMLMDIVNNTKPKGEDLVEYMRRKVTEWFGIPDPMVYFMAASMTPLGLHTTDEAAIECAEKMGFDCKVYKVEDEGKISELSRESAEI